MNNHALYLLSQTSRLVKLVSVLLLVLVPLALIHWRLDEPVFAAMAAREAALQETAEQQQQLLGVKLTNWLWQHHWLGTLRPQPVQDHRAACPALAPTLLQHLPLLGRLVATSYHQQYISCMEALLQQGAEVEARWHLLCVVACSLLGGLVVVVLLARRIRGDRDAPLIHDLLEGDEVLTEEDEDFPDGVEVQPETNEDLPEKDEDLPEGFEVMQQDSISSESLKEEKIENEGEIEKKGKSQKKKRLRRKKRVTGRSNMKRKERLKIKKKQKKKSLKIKKRLRRKRTLNRKGWRKLKR